MKNTYNQTGIISKHPTCRNQVKYNFGDDVNKGLVLYHSKKLIKMYLAWYRPLIIIKTQKKFPKISKIWRFYICLCLIKWQTQTLLGFFFFFWHTGLYTEQYCAGIWIPTSGMHYSAKAFARENKCHSDNSPNCIITLHVHAEYFNGASNLA